MAKKLLVRTPITTDGITLAYDEQKKIMYKETILELTAKANFNSINANLPSHLKHELLEVEIDNNGAIIESKTSKKSQS